MNIVVGIIIGLFMLMLLVTLHELGHFIMARRNGVEVEEFGICFPPRAVCWRKVDGKWKRIPRKDWENMPGEGLILSLNFLPIGGFCQMKGESAADKKKGTFGAASFWGKTKILFGGVAMNWLTAIVILTVLAWTGMPHFLENQFQVEGDTTIVSVQDLTFGAIKEDSPASRADLKEGDVVKTVAYDKVAVMCDQAPCPQMFQNAVKPESYAWFMKQNDEHAGQDIELVIDRNGEELTKVVTLNGMDADYRIGAGISSSEVYRSTWSAPVVGVMTTLQITGETFKGVGSLLVNFFSGIVKFVIPNENTHQEGADALKQAGDSMSGPVGIVGVLFPAFAQSGLGNLMFLVALISISLACMNVLPIPALDGGRWMLIGIFKALKKPLTKEREEKIVSRAFMVLIILAIVVTVLDVTRIAGN